eukprot:3701118-Rhodomonas_salina.4
MSMDAQSNIADLSTADRPTSAHETIALPHTAYAVSSWGGRPPRPNGAISSHPVPIPPYARSVPTGVAGSARVNKAYALGQYRAV